MPGVTIIDVNSSETIGVTDLMGVQRFKKGHLMNKEIKLSFVGYHDLVLTVSQDKDYIVFMEAAKCIEGDKAFNNKEFKIKRDHLINPEKTSREFGRILIKN